MASMAEIHAQRPRHGRRLSIPERNVAAEARAVEEGHRALVQPDGSVEVLSDTHGDLGKRYRVEFVALLDGLVLFSCRPHGPRAFTDDHLAASTLPGVVPCKHAALAARRLEREGLAVLDAHGRWTVEPSLLAWLTAVEVDEQPDDPFAGF